MKNKIKMMKNSDFINELYFLYEIKFIKKFFGYDFIYN